jgi:hypothetical protein
MNSLLTTEHACQSRNGALGGTRTHNPKIRNLVLCPVELRELVFLCRLSFGNHEMVVPRGLEPPPSGFANQRSIPLSYGTLSWNMVPPAGVEPAPNPASKAGALSTELRRQTLC